MTLKMKSGIYLIVDPAMGLQEITHKLATLVAEDLAAIQLWDNFHAAEDLPAFIEAIVRICHPRKIPVLVNNRWELLEQTGVDGVHFDAPSPIAGQLRKKLGRDIIMGVTCQNDLSVLDWAMENELSYLSFCSMFPSSTANSCALVDFKVVKEAAERTTIPLFLAGGIRPENMALLEGLNYSGIAVVSGIMNAADPAGALKNYQQKIKES